MNFVAPVWYLNQECPECEQGNSLLYIRCLSCNATFLICEETKSVFVEGIGGSTLLNFEDRCLLCESGTRPVTGDEMLTLGFLPSDYN